MLVSFTLENDSSFIWLIKGLAVAKTGLTSLFKSMLITEKHVCESALS